MRDRICLRRFMQLGCIFLLIFAQQAALTHALWHLRAQMPRHEVNRAEATRTHGHLPAVSALCAFDAAFGQVLGAAPCADRGNANTASSTGAVPHRARASVPYTFFAPRSRGPPVALLD